MSIWPTACGRALHGRKISLDERKMDFTCRTMKGFVFVEPEGIDMEEDLDYWVELCLVFNPKAKSSKKK